MAFRLHLHEQRAFFQHNYTLRHQEHKSRKQTHLLGWWRLTPRASFSGVFEIDVNRRYRGPLIRLMQFLPYLSLLEDARAVDPL